eukprot:scaffold959_cov258-Pinguiococcus_pyrenoidosus.AAC.3
MVACASLTPVSSKELMTLRESKRGWAHGGTARAHAGRSTQRRKGGKRKMQVGVPTHPPKTSMEFSRDWRRRCRTAVERWQYLELIGPAGVARLFQFDMEATLLGEIVEVLFAKFCSAEVSECAGGDFPVELDGDEPLLIAGWLDALSRSGRFGLNASLLSAAEGDHARRLVEKVEAAEDSASCADLVQEFRGAIKT